MQHRPSLDKLMPILTCLAIAFGFVLGSSAAHAESERPNIVVILADDMGYSDIGSYGGEIRTPHIDQLANDGVRFTQFYNAARCCPTRASLLTGLYPHEAGIGWMVYRDWGPGYIGHLNDQSVTIAEALKRAGYFTAMTGKWHVGHQSKDVWPSERGFDRFYGIHKHVDSYWKVLPNTPLYRDGEKIIDGSRKKRPDYEGRSGNTFYTTDVFTDKAINYIHEASDKQKPMFLYVAYNAPHWPLEAPQEDIERYRGAYDEGWGELRREKLKRMKEMDIVPADTKLAPSPAPEWSSLTDKQQRELAFRRAIYAAQIDRMDQNVGRIVETLEARGMLDNTLLMFLSDNGSAAEPDDKMFGYQFEQNRLANFDAWRTQSGRSSSQGKAWAVASNAPFRKYKKWAHEGGIRTPLIMHWPDELPQTGTFIREPGHVVDLMPTCLAVAGASYPRSFKGRDVKPMRGRNLLPMIEGEAAEPRTLYFEHERHAAVRRGPWKLVTGNAQEPSSWSLYHMRRDPSERHDLAAEHPARVNRLKAAFNDWARETNVLPWPGERSEP